MSVSEIALPSVAGKELSKQSTVQLFRLAASLSNPKSLHARVYDFWEELDENFFCGRLSPVLITLGVTEHSACLGQCTAIGGQARITLHQALVWPSTANPSDTRWGMPIDWMGEQLLRDCLLHEMQHQAQAELALDTKKSSGYGMDPHHCKSWSDLCNQSAHKLGLEATWYPVFKRTKVAVPDAHGNLTRVNKWVVANPSERPAGSRVAEMDEVTGFPFRTFQRLGLAQERYSS